MSADFPATGQASQAVVSLLARPKSPSILSTVLGRLKRVPRWAYLSSLATLLLTALLLVYALVPTGAARLRVVCGFGFRSAQLSIMVDGDLVYSGTVAGPNRKRFGLFDKNTAANFSRTFTVKPGQHTIQVHLNALSEGYDQAKVAYAEFPQDKESVLIISSARRTGLTLNFQGAATAQAAAGSSSQSSPTHLFSILISVIGTMLSASISFLVQEFWRSHRNAR